jgi:ABC-type transport system involved in cytochrome bd biosynthesis fused ATPase/permease subunit
MMRYLEYAYLLAAVAIVVFMALNFAELPTANKVMLSLGGMLCAFMYSFRRKQRTFMEELDRKRDADEAAADDNLESEDGH